MFRHRRHSEVPSLNTSSTADISFMLLIFFLITSSMDSGKGLKRQLPPPPQDQEQVADIRQEDIITVKLDAAGRLTLNGDAWWLSRPTRRPVTRPTSSCRMPSWPPTVR